VILKNCGHVPQEEKSETFAELVSEFCHSTKGLLSEKERDDLRVEA
jgi:hypothetical protein